MYAAIRLSWSCRCTRCAAARGLRFGNEFWQRIFEQQPQSTNKEISMNKDQVKGAAKDIGGKIQEEAGKLVGSEEQQAKGLANQVEGKVQQKVGDLKEALKDIAKDGKE
jgi:uncharacterized protein YjbJ (UPF0337 family)